jgi:hypothetical protein
MVNFFKISDTLFNIIFVTEPYKFLQFFRLHFLWNLIEMFDFLVNFWFGAIYITPRTNSRSLFKNTWIYRVLCYEGGRRVLKNQSRSEGLNKFKLSKLVTFFRDTRYARKQNFQNMLFACFWFW